jgi:hypothetical protein
MAALSAAVVSAAVVRRFSLWGPPLIWMAAIFAVSADSDPPAPALVSDKLMHLIAYALLAVVVFRAVAGGLPARVTWLSAGFTLLITGLYGLSDEIHQSYVPGRTAELNDLYADIAGAAIALIGCWGWGILEPLIPHPPSRIPTPRGRAESTRRDQGSGSRDPDSGPGIRDHDSGLRIRD